MSDFERVKEALDLKAVIAQVTGFTWDKKGHLSECPFCGGHDCFSVPKQAGKDKHFKCHHGSCDKSGDVFVFLEEYEHLDRGEALFRAAELAGIEIKRKSPEEQERAAVRRAANLTAREKIFLEAADYYHGRMLENGGKDYLTKTRGHLEETIKSFRVGSSDGKLFEHLKGKGFTDAEIFGSGLVFKDKETEAVNDYFPAGVMIYPHFSSGVPVHFTQKDPNKEFKGALAGDYRGNWSFYNQDALSKYREIIVVEGENDLQSCADAGSRNVIAFCGNPSEKRLRTLLNYATKKHLYLWMDKDEAGDKYVRQIIDALGTGEYYVRVIRHPGETNDPDEYIQKLDPKERGRRIRQLMDDALEPLAWDVAVAGELPSFAEKARTLEERQFWTKLSVLPETERLALVDTLKKIGFNDKAINEQLEKQNDILSKVHKYIEGQADAKRPVKSRLIAEWVFKWFEERGKFFRTGAGDVYLYYRSVIYEIGNNLPFNELMDRLTHLAAVSPPGKDVWYYLRVFCQGRGQLIEVTSWIHTDLETDAVYLNLNSTKNRIIKLLPGKEPEEIPNGTNPEGILLHASHQIKPFEFLPDCDPDEGFKTLRELVFDNLACSKADKYLVVCWAFTFIFLEFNKTRGLLKCTGASSSGKSTATALLSFLLYGDDQVGQSSAASAFSEAAHNPLVILDNLENKDLSKSLVNFLLLAANSAPKKKRKQGSDTDVITERVNSLVAITAIEPFPGHLPELINRTLEIIFLPKYQRNGFVMHEALRALLKKRNLILSSMLKVASRKIMPRLGERGEWLTVLQKQYSGHNKDRMNEFLSLMTVVLEELLEFVPYFEKGSFMDGAGADAAASEILGEWVKTQNTLAIDTEVASNPALDLTNGLLREYWAKILEDKDRIRSSGHPDYENPDVAPFTHPEYLLTMAIYPWESCNDEETGRMRSRRRIEFTCTSGELNAAFNRYCRNNGIRNPFPNAAALGARLANDQKIFEKDGWEFVTKPNSQYVYRRRGRDYRRFAKYVD